MIYVIKENRTYDQIFGDLKESRADDTCLYFGEEFTPNHHRLAREFGIYDNFFDSAEVSFNGHTWSMAGINTGWNEQQWQINYSTSNFTYDSEGRNNDIIPVEHDQSDVDTPQGGYIWDSVLAAGKSIRMYGEFCSNPPLPLKRLRKGDKLPPYLVHPRIGEVSPYPWSVPLFGLLDKNGRLIGGTIATKTAFKNAYQPLFPDFEQLHPDVLRFVIWKRDFDRIVRQQQETGKDELPAFSIVRFGADHTRGVAPEGLPRMRAWPTTIWRSECLSRPSRATSTTGETLRSSCSRMTRRPAATTWIHIEASCCSFPGTTRATAAVPRSIHVS